MKKTTTKNAAARQTWEKTEERRGEYGAVYESNDGWTIEVVLRNEFVSGSSREIRYVVDHYLLGDPKGEEGIFHLLADAKRYARTHEAFDA